MPVTVAAARQVQNQVGSTPNSPNSTLAPLAISNLVVSGTIGTSATTIDINSSFILTQTTPGITVTLSNPASLPASRVVTLMNSTASTQSFTFYGRTLAVGEVAEVFWNGSIWALVSVGTNLAAGYAYVRSSGSNITSNLASTDHVQFTVVMNAVGGDITSDTTTTYTNANGVNSLGRFLLKANRTYELEGSIGDAAFIASANSWVSYSWFNADTGVAINIASQAFVYNTGAAGAFSFSSNTSASAIAQSIFSPTVDTRVELRITNSSGFTGYGGGLNSIASYAKIKVISGNSPVTGQSVDYVRLSKTSTQSIAAANTPITFNSFIGNITANTGTGAITLTAGKTYELMAGVNSVTAPAVPRPVFTWFNQTTGLAIGDQFGFYSPADTAGNGGGGGISHMILTPSVTTIIELRSLVAITGGLIAFGDFGGGSGETAWAAVKQLGSTATTATPLPAVQVFTSSGTYTPTAGVRYVDVEMVGGGGGGLTSAGTGAGQTYMGGGGGAGAYVKARLNASQIGASQAVTIGNGGSASTNGGASQIGTLLIANGGLSGSGSGTISYNASGGSVAGVPGAGGTFSVATGQDLGSSNGETGRRGVITANSNVGAAAQQGGFMSLGGISKMSLGALNTAGVYNTSGARSDGGVTEATNCYGTGGGGAYSSFTGAGVSGGTGISGIVRITEYFN